jgi:hypothetical protein
MRRLHAWIVVWVAVVVAVVAACGSSGESTFIDPNNLDSGGSSGSSGSSGLLPGDGGVDLDGSSYILKIEPADQVVVFTTGQPAPTVQYKATANGQAVNAVYSIDRGELGTVDQASGLFTASGKVGGKANVTASWNGRTAATSITVKLVVVENGSAAPDAGGGGAGGNGGVGGEGPGAAVAPATVTALEGTPVADPGLTLLYPYDGTVWPRGILAPLLQWKPGAQGDYDAVYIKIEETAFTYQGTFAKTATPFIHHPITQQTWKQLTASNAGEDVTVTIVLSKGATAYGPMTVKWKVASAPLKGIVYYNSYGTKLAKNYGGTSSEKGALPDNSKFGGATLAIKGGSTDPVLVAGGNGDRTYCRVCHSVAANGSVLITQREDASDRAYSTYDLKSTAETTMSPEGPQATYAWSGIYPDGSMFLSDSSPAPGSTTLPNVLYSVVSGAGPKTPPVVAATGWPVGFRASFPAFAPDGKKVAFTMYAGATGADKRTLGMMTFDATTKAFGPLTALYTPPNVEHTALYPAFLPTNDAVVFEVETRSNGRDYGGTRADGDSGPNADIGARGELWWLDVATKTPKPLAKLNGAGYVPVDATTAHGDDATLNYEPTVNPVPSGGYAWVVFTSRRMYGNVATINPHHSDPRYHDISTTPTPKKLWVAAIDLNAPAGTDPSHPAFYLPAQELLAGNSRGYWVVDPCKANASSCETGDECCGGYCRPDTTGALVCSDKVPVCAQEFENCTKDSDCCSAPSVLCINGRCAVPAPK